MADGDDAARQRDTIAEIRERSRRTREKAEALRTGLGGPPVRTETVVPPSGPPPITPASAPQTAGRRNRRLTLLGAGFCILAISFFAVPALEFFDFQVGQTGEEPDPVPGFVWGFSREPLVADGPNLAWTSGFWDDVSGIEQLRRSIWVAAAAGSVGLSAGVAWILGHARAGFFIGGPSGVLWAWAWIAPLTLVDELNEKAVAVGSDGAYISNAPGVMLLVPLGAAYLVALGYGGWVAFGAVRATSKPA